MEFGEEWAECAAREVLEETGLEIENIKYAMPSHMFRKTLLSINFPISDRFLTANNAVDIQTDYHYVV